MDVYLEKRKKMVEKLKRELNLSEKVVKAMLKVPRHVFVPEYASEAYNDYPLPIGYGQTISAPHMVAIMCELLELKEGEKVLEIGAGTGYLSKMLIDGNPGSSVTLVDFDEIMLEMAKYNLRDFSKNAKFLKKDLKDPAWIEGIPKNQSAVVTAYTFHVLQPKRKTDVYSEIYSLLNSPSTFTSIFHIAFNGI